MGQAIDLTAILTPKPGQSEAFVELFANCARYAQENEPGTLRYELQRGTTDKKTGTVELVIRETYADQEAADKHLAGPHVVKLLKVLAAGTMIENTKVIYTEPGLGYVRSKI